MLSFKKVLLLKNIFIVIIIVGSGDSGYSGIIIIIMCVCVWNDTLLLSERNVSNSANLHFRPWYIARKLIRKQSFSCERLAVST